MSDYARCPHCHKPMHKEIGFSLPTWVCETHGSISFCEDEIEAA
jgi:hypothetical protein